MWKPMNQADMLYEKFKVWRLWHYQEISRCLYHMTKSIMYFQEECDQEQNEKPVSTNLFSLSPSHLQSSAMEINPVWVLLIIIYKSFFNSMFFSQLSLYYYVSSYLFLFLLWGISVFHILEFLLLPYIFLIFFFMILFSLHFCYVLKCVFHLNFQATNSYLYSD